MAISRQNARSISRRCDGAPGDFIGDRPVNAVIHPAGLPINTSETGVLRRPVESAQYTPIAFIQRLLDAGVDASVGSVGDALDNVMAESTIGSFKTELIRRHGPWRAVDDVEIATLDWVHWFNTDRSHDGNDDLTPIVAEQLYYAHQTALAAAG